MEAQNLLRGATLILWAVVMNGCAAVAPVISGLPGATSTSDLEVHTQTTVRLEEGNFVTIRTNVVGSSKGFKLLGFITIVPATLDQAMNRLYASAEVEHGRPQTLVHLMIEHSGVYVILFSIPRVTARADLIEFLPVQEPGDEDEPRGNPGIQRLLYRRGVGY